MEKGEIVEKLVALSQLLEIRGDNPFKIRAYRNSAEIIGAFPGKIEEFIELAKKNSIKGIGAQLTELIEQLSKNLNISLFEELSAEVPETLLEILNLPGVGVKKVKQLYQELEIKNIEQLEKACQENKLIALKGFSEKTQSQILVGIGKYQSYSKQLIYPKAFELAKKLKELIILECSKIEICSEIRRALPTISEISLIVLAENQLQLEKILQQASFLREVKSINNLIQGKFEKGFPFFIHCVSKENFAWTMFSTTGSEEHVNKVVARGTKKDFNSEEELYRHSRLCFIPPETRENKGEIEEAAELFKNNLQFNLIDTDNIKGIIHAHSNYSDGKDSLEELASFVKEMGFQYLVISDHSRSAIYAGGLGVEKIKAQHAEIDFLNEKLKPFKIFKGIESDILADGSLDYPDDVLEVFDFVIASVHTRFSQSKEEMTARIIKALENPYTTLLAHPTGRLLLEREAYEVDLEKIIESAIKNNVIIEINSNPKRLDLDWSYLNLAKKQGLKFAISPDAHSKNGVLNIHYGLLMAKKGRLGKKDFINCLEISDFENYLKNVRKLKQKSKKH